MLGFSHNVIYGGLSFQVETEVLFTRGDRRIVSNLFFGGMVVSKLRQPLRIEDGPGYQRRLREQVKQQHRRLLRDLKRGKLDGVIASTPGTGELAAINGRRRQTGAGVAAVEVWPKRQPEEPASRVTELIASLSAAVKKGRPAAPALEPEPVAEEDDTRDAARCFEAGMVALRGDDLHRALTEWTLAASMEPDSSLYEAGRCFVRLLLSAAKKA